jgi:hypothetical protein
LKIHYCPAKIYLVRTSLRDAIKQVFNKRSRFFTGQQ